jgi:hypothetical protein
MEIVKTVQVLASAARGASGSVDVDVPNGADSVVFFTNITANSGTTPTLTPKLSHVVPNDPTRIVDVITGPAHNTNAAFRIALLPGCTAVANVIANEPVTGKVRYTYTLGGTTPNFTFSVVAVFLRS